MEINIIDFVNQTAYYAPKISAMALALNNWRWWVKWLLADDRYVRQQRRDVMKQIWRHSTNQKWSRPQRTALAKTWNRASYCRTSQRRHPRTTSLRVRAPKSMLYWSPHRWVSPQAWKYKWRAVNSCKDPSTPLWQSSNNSNRNMRIDHYRRPALSCRVLCMCHASVLPIVRCVRQRDTRRQQQQWQAVRILWCRWRCRWRVLPNAHCSNWWQLECLLVAVRKTYNYFIWFCCRLILNLHVITAASSCTAAMGASHDCQNGCSKYCANVSAVMALPVGTSTSSATHRYRKAGSGPNAAPM